jgi:putative transcriptional regulator
MIREGARCVHVLGEEFTAMADVEMYNALLMDRANGALDPAALLVLNVHIQMSQEAQEAATLADVLGGALLDAITPVPMGALPLTRSHSRMVEEPSGELAAEARSSSLITLAQSDPSALSWKWRWFGVREHDLPIAGAKLLKMNAGVAVPRHTHTQYELTLVLCGRYLDENGAYQPGDLAIAEPGQRHRPRTMRDGGCLCLTADITDAAAGALAGQVDRESYRYII